jgi:hypothetical protein
MRFLSTGKWKALTSNRDLASLSLMRSRQFLFGGAFCDNTTKLQYYIDQFALSRFLPLPPSVQFIVMKARLPGSLLPYKTSTLTTSRIFCFSSSVNFLLRALASTLLIPSSSSSTSFLGRGSSDFSSITRFLTASNVTVWRVPSASALIVSLLTGLLVVLGFFFRMA